MNLKLKLELLRFVYRNIEKARVRVIKAVHRVGSFNNRRIEGGIQLLRFRLGHLSDRDMMRCGCEGCVYALAHLALEAESK